LCPNLKHCFDISLEGQRKIMRNRNQDGKSLGQNLNLELPEYELEALTVRLVALCFVCDTLYIDTSIRGCNI
jgi:hypothetical protein